MGQGLLVFLPLPLILQTAEDAKDFFKRKIDFLTKQMEKIQPALQEKHAMKQGEFYPELLFCKIISIVFCLSASGRWGWDTRTLWCMCGGSRKFFRNQFSPFTLGSRD